MSPVSWEKKNDTVNKAQMWIHLIVYCLILKTISLKIALYFGYVLVIL